jgi:hypothetical protein
MLRMLEMTLEWLGNLEEAVGPVVLMDAMPNDFGGREEIRSWLALLQSGEGWTFDEGTGQIRDADGWSLAVVPHSIAGGLDDLERGRLMARVPAMLRKLGELGYGREI